MLVEKGHQIGNHTFNHISGWKSKNKEYFQNINKFNDLVKSNLFRPPYGKIKLSQIIKLKKQKFKIILWSVLSYDFDKNISKEQCLKNVIDNFSAGSIIVFHDSEKAANNLYYALPLFIDYAIKENYIFKTLDYNML
jgi:peptidoglycan/xylan/chitin deacetylase (PgdA/CDA1 family)